MFGIKMNEFMIGTHQFTDNEPKGDFPLEFSLTWGNKNLFKWLNPFSGEFLHNEARGHITVGGLVDKADCTGTLDLMYFSGRKIRYTLDFKDGKEKSYRYVGEKINIWPWNLHKTHVTCYGTITDLSANKVISKSIVYFPFSETLDFLLSTRLVRGSVFKD
jgi:hypothetical protein